MSNPKFRPGERVAYISGDDAILGRVDEILLSGDVYHYRIVARNVNGLNVGKDRTFTTKNTTQPSRLMPTVTSRATPFRDRRRPYRFTVRGKVLPPAGVSRSRACRGRVTVRFKTRGKTVRLRRVRVNSSCRYRARTGVAVKAGRTIRVKIRFGGNGALRARSAPSRMVKTG